MQACVHLICRDVRVPTHFHPRPPTPSKAVRSMAAACGGRRWRQVHIALQQTLLLAAALAAATMLPVGRCQSWPAACNSLPAAEVISNSPATLTPGKRYTTSLGALELTGSVTVGDSQVLCIHSSA